jgi:arginyl-tRNA synthetase
MAATVLDLLADRFRAAVTAAFGPDVSVPDPLVLPTRDPRHGDYQCSAPMALARQLKQKPAELAEKLVAGLQVDDICQVEVVPPGFVNLRLSPSWIASRLAAAVADERLGLPPAERPELVVIDYSAPNMARQMHVGHLRSTIIGDCLAHLFELLGHQVDRVNHIGDYGAQFGVLLAEFEDRRAADPAFQVEDPDRFYREANARAKDDAEFHERSRQRVVGLQSGEPGARAVWLEFLDSTRRTNQPVYDLLGIDDLEERGESFYAPMLPDVVAELEDKGLLVEDQGAKVVFVPGFQNREGEPLPLIVVNQHGGYGYATTDLAAVRHRFRDLGADRALYVVDAGQSQHLEMVFATGRAAGWVPEGAEIAHIGFGLVLGEDGKRLRARTGDNPKLAELLQEAVDRSRAFVLTRAEERGEAPPDDLDRVAAAIGIGAVKYADLSQNRQSNYAFSYDKMLSLKGNTAPYLQYAYARIRSILTEAGWSDGPPAGGVEMMLDTDQELALAKALLELPDVLLRVQDDYQPNHLCAHLYELSQAYNQFYEHCPVLRSEEPLRSSRLALCHATAATLALGLGVLGIEVLDRI